MNPPSLIYKDNSLLYFNNNREISQKEMDFIYFSNAFNNEYQNFLMNYNLILNRQNICKNMINGEINLPTMNLINNNNHLHNISIIDKGSFYDKNIENYQESKNFLNEKNHSLFIKQISKNQNFKANIVKMKKKKIIRKSPETSTNTDMLSEILKENEIESQSLNQRQNKKTLRCKYQMCKKSFYKIPNYMKHIKICQFSDKTYKCNFQNCLKSFSQIGNLKKHKLIHFDKKVYTCEFCQTVFSSYKRHKAHLKNHAEQKYFLCDIDGCNTKFKDKGNLKFHQNLFHAEKCHQIKHICDHPNCSIAFKTIKQKILHHNNQEEECRAERISLIKLIRKFKFTLSNFINKNDKNEKNALISKEIENLKSFYEKTQKEVFDSDCFFYFLGENFGDVVKNVDSV